MANVILEFFDAVNRRDLGAIEACYHEDYVSIQPCFPSRRFEGAKTVSQIYERLYPKLPGVRYEIQRTSFTGTDSDRVVGFVEVHMTDDARKTNVKGVFILETVNQKIKSGTLYMMPVDDAVGDIDTYIDSLVIPK